MGLIQTELTHMVIHKSLFQTSLRPPYENLFKHPYDNLTNTFTNIVSNTLTTTLRTPLRNRGEIAVRPPAAEARASERVVVKGVWKGGAEMLSK